MARTRKDILAASRKSRRKRILIRSAILLFLFLGAIFSGVYFFLNMNALQIKEISIEGNNLVSAAELKDSVNNFLEGKYFWVFPKSNIFIFSKERMASEILRSFPRAKEVKVGRKFFNGLSLKIAERSTLALLCQKETCYFVDEDGIVFENAPYFSGNVYLTFFDERSGAEASSSEAVSSNALLGNSFLNKEEFKKLLDFSKLVSNSNINVGKIILKNEGVYELVTKDGWRILLNEKNKTKEAYANMATAISTEIKDKTKKLDYIDLRFGNKVYFKYK